MNIEDIKPKKEDFLIIKKKTIVLLAILVILGFLVGLITSNLFINEANQKIDEYNENMREWYQNWNNSFWNNSTWSNSTSQIYDETTIFSNFNPYLKNLNYLDVIMLSLGIINICIAIFLLIGIIITYLGIFFKSKSPYIIGLIFVFLPLLIILLFLINTLHALYFSSALNYSVLGVALGFGVEGLGVLISIVSFFMTIGFCILFYLINE